MYTAVRLRVTVAIGALWIVSAGARADIVYDFSAGAGVDRFAYKNSIPSAPIPPAANSIPATAFTATEYTAVSTSNNARHTTANIGGANRAAVRFVFTLVEDASSLTSLAVFWEGQSAGGPDGTVQVWLWNDASAAYTFVGSTNSTSDVTLSFVAAGDASEFVDASRQVTILVVNTTDTRGISTDYVRLAVRQCSVAEDCDDNNPCTDQSCSGAGACVYTNNSASCSDGNPCTLSDVCAAGVCQGGAAPNCSTSGNQCNTASCSPIGAEGNCDTLTPVADGTDCDDGLACNVGESCQSGSCTGGSSPDCSTSGNQCNTASCSPIGAEGNCDTLTPVGNGTDCDDGLACNVGEACLDGTCAGGTSPDCSTSGDQCNTASCNPVGTEGNCATLTSVIDGTTCDDGLFCNVGEICTAGVCGGGTPRDCSAEADQCNTGTCNETTNECQAQPVGNGADCDDGLACNVGEACLDGACTGGTTQDCSTLGNQCNTASCNPTGTEGNCGTLTPVGNGTDCDDGLACNVGEACLDGTCTGGTTQDCSTAGDQCNTASCSPTGTEGNCDTLTPVQNGTDCDDGLACNVGEACLDGTCTGGTSQDCSTSGDQCNTASCNPTGAEGNCDTITPVDDGTLCSDGLFCTQPDQCLAGLCVGVGQNCPDEFCDELADSCVECLLAEQCDDTVDCTADTCVLGECVFTPLDANCPDDGLFCNGVEYCDPLLDCRSADDACPVGQFCDEESDACGECLTPLVIAAGERYLRITPLPADSPVRMALVVRPNCPGAIAQFAGAPEGANNVAVLVDDPADAARLTPTEWGSVLVAGNTVIPGTLYDIRTDCHGPADPALTSPASAATPIWGDTVGGFVQGTWLGPDGRVDISDVTAILDAFRHAASAPPFTQVDIWGCVPDQDPAIIDAVGALDGFRHITFTRSTGCAAACP